MPIVEVEEIAQFKTWGEPHKGAGRYKLVFTNEDEAILYPTVTTRRVETVYMRKVFDAQRKALEEWWGEKALICKRFLWREDHNPYEVKSGGD